MLIGFLFSYQIQNNLFFQTTEYGWLYARKSGSSNPVWNRDTRQTNKSDVVSLWTQWWSPPTHEQIWFRFGSFRKNLMGVCLFVRWNWEHLEEESEVLNVVRAVIVVASEPEHCVGIGILVSNNTGCSSRGDQNRRRKRSSSLRGNQTKVIVPIDILLFELV